GTLEPQSSRTYNRSRLSTLVSLKPFSSAKKVELGIPFRLSAEILLLRNGQFFSEKSWSVPNFSQALGKLEFSGQDSSFLIKLSEAMRASNAAVSSVEVESVGDQVFHFSFSRCDLSHEDGQDALVAVVSTFAHLKSLKLYGLGLTDQALEKLMRVLPRSLQKLVLNENVIGFRGIHILANALTSLPNLLELHLRENPIGKGDAANVSVSIHALADAISLHPALRCLQINGCDITDANALRYLIAHLGKVSWLDASRNVCGNALKGTAEEPSLGQLINRSNIREYLALAACGMNFNTIESLISELESNDKVQRLVLDGNGFIRGHSARLEDQRHVSLTQRIEAIEQRNQGNAYFSDAVRAFMPEALPVLPSEAAIAAAAEVKASGVEGPKVSPFSGAVAFASSACEFTQDSKRVESSSEEKSSLQDIFNEIDAEERRRNGRDFADNLLQRFQEDAPKKHSLNPELPGVSAQKVEENRSQLIALKDQIVARLSDQPSFNQVYCHMRERSLLWVGIRRLFQLGTGESLARQKHVFSERSVWEDTIIQPLLNLIARQADAMPRMNFPVGLAQSNSVHMAVHVGNLESLKTLLSDPIYEAGLNIPNANGLTPIQVAVTQDRLDILKVLEPKTSLMGASPEGFELLHLCAQFGSFECYQYLRAKPGFLPESRNNKYGANVFQVASAYAQMNFLLKVYELEFSTRDSRTFKDFIQEHYLLHVVGALSSNPDLLWEPIALLIDKGADI
ncbi:MAG: hypothetical protein EBX40_05620, partial [Gammaproteobacteria bacterium]|nr:hypothetical protein [Gammaproteobacteria bacterium]